MVGNYVWLQLEAVNGRSPYIWTITGLPPGVFGSSSGVISGSVLQTGYFTVSVEASDSMGRAADCYLTMNVQPVGLLPGKLSVI